MAISLKDVEHVAMLARLELTAEEKEMYTGQLNAILEYIGKLQELDTSQIPPTAHVLPIHNVLREDQVRPSMDRAEVLQNAPYEEEGQFRVPKIV
ncbi:Asp-tRNA(Asn)/Glu-tRNA(Gln) amidotransferase subunit GatC [Candidatus Formimonas warabiya]|uniref:Aspartyl/glutamyl-tRNA(Asn/Gln) amidotransferase subunit C n=1 Tax=Formimonas warabiya TaxID=1761012 RepID=A0A3G1KLZ5_FORW1|nr:Asp-tRNA(Asn)/Glu-tRNA(Gln) amidotransferase subunit GatC [Candidatus Formimonas warabiya]ATW23453.1 asparaginyl/glutamyl-tRNA amidotransferase subunit C [Candidatus Formimonas warabiya]